MYITFYDKGGFASQVMSLLVTQTLAELFHLKYLHLPTDVVQHCSSQDIENWLNLFQWDKQACAGRALPARPVQFVLHFFCKDEFQGRYTTLVHLKKDYKRYATERLGVSKDAYDFSIRLHTMRESVEFEVAPETVHVLMDNIVWFDFCKPPASEVLCRKFEAIKRLFQESLKQHAVAKSMQTLPVKVAIHFRTGDMLEDASHSIVKASIQREFGLALFYAKEKLKYRLSNIQVPPLIRAIKKSLVKRRVPHTFLVCAPVQNPVILDSLKSAGIEKEVEFHIGENMVDSFVRISSSDMVVSQSGGFARLAGLLSDRLVFFTRSRPDFISRYRPLLSSRSPLARRAWGLHTPADLFRVGKCISDLLSERGNDTNPSFHHSHENRNPPT